MLRKCNGLKTATGEMITVIKLDKSGGCVDRDEAYLDQFRHAHIREYFLGNVKSILSPHIQQVDFSSMSIYRLSECESELLLPESPIKTLL